jgi:hypothetical protein
MTRLVRALAVAFLAASMAPASPAVAGGLSVSIVGDGYIVNPGPNAEVIYYGPQDYVAPPVYPAYGYGYGYGYGYPPPPVAYYPGTPYGYYGMPGYYSYGGLYRGGFARPYGFAYGRRGLRLPR